MRLRKALRNTVIAAGIGVGSVGGFAGVAAAAPAAHAAHSVQVAAASCPAGQQLVHGACQNMHYE